MAKWWVKTRPINIGAGWRHFGPAPYVPIEAETREAACEQIVPKGERLNTTHADGTPEKPFTIGGISEVCATPWRQRTPEEIRSLGIEYNAHVDLLSDPNDPEAKLPADWEEKYKLIDLVLLEEYIPPTVGQD